MTQLERYRKWWEGKTLQKVIVMRGRSITWSTTPLPTIDRVQFAGPPSCCYGRVLLHLDSGRVVEVRGTGSHRPRKRDVQVVA